MAVDVPGPTLGFLRRIGRSLLCTPRLLRWSFVLGHAAFIWGLSSVGNVGPSDDSALWAVLGNLAHAPLFGFLAMFSATAILREEAHGWVRIAPRSVFLVLLLVGLYAVIDETHQGYVPGRNASPLDIVTDLVGGACVLWIATYLGLDQRTERGLLLRLAAGIGLCVASASLASLF